jgi:chemotaxis response regulator CheB
MIGVVITGSAHDGTDGLRPITAAGGLDGTTVLIEINDRASFAGRTPI